MAESTLHQDFHFYPVLQLISLQICTHRIRKELRRKDMLIFTLQNAVCYLKGNPDVTQILPSPCEMMRFSATALISLLVRRDHGKQLMNGKKKHILQSQVKIFSANSRFSSTIWNFCDIFYILQKPKMLKKIPQKFQTDEKKIWNLPR